MKTLCIDVEKFLEVCDGCGTTFPEVDEPHFKEVMSGILETARVQRPRIKESEGEEPIQARMVGVWVAHMMPAAVTFAGTFEVRDGGNLIKILQAFPKATVKALISEPGQDCWLVTIPETDIDPELTEPLPKVQRRKTEWGFANEVFGTKPELPDDPTQAAAAWELLYRDQAPEYLAAAGVRGALLRGRVDEVSMAALRGAKPWPMGFETLAAFIDWRLGCLGPEPTPKEHQTEIRDAILEWFTTPPLSLHNVLAANFKPFADQWGAVQVEPFRPDQPPLRENARELAAEIVKVASAEGPSVEEITAAIIKWAATIPRKNPAVNPVADPKWPQDKLEEAGRNRSDE